MPIYNQVQTETITNGGGTINLACGNSTTTRYVFSGTATLAANWVIQPSGTPFQGMEFDIRWQSACTIGANSVTIFGTVLTADQALNDLIITCYYNGSSWDVDIQQDGVQDIWEVGTGVGSVKLVEGGTSTSSGISSVNAGLDNTVSGDYSFSAGVSNTASGASTTAIGASNTASSSNTVALGNGNTANSGGAIAIGVGNTSSGSNSVAVGYNNTASADFALATGYTTTASGDFSESGGILSIAERRGQFSRASGNHLSVLGTDYAQYSKLTAFGNTSNATPSVLDLGDAATITIPTNSIAFIRGEAIAIQVSGAAGSVGDSASWCFNGCIKNVSGTTSLVDTIRYQDNTGAWAGAAQRTQDAAAAAWTLVPTADNATDTLVLTATGEANKDIYWLVNIELTEIRYTP